MTTTSIYQFMSHLGISSNATRIYIKLVELGPTTILVLSKAVGLPRTTVYQNIDCLIDKGVVSELIVGAKRQVAALSPSNLKIIVEDKKKDLEEKASEVKRLEDNLQSVVSALEKHIPDNQYPKTQVKFVEGYHNVARVYDHILLSPEIRTYLNLEQINDAFPENFDKFQKASKKDIKIWDLIQDTPKGRALYFSNEYISKKYLTKFLPSGTVIQGMDYLIYDGNIAIIQGGIFPSAVIISNKLIYDNAVGIYDALWNLLPEVRK